MVDRSIHTPTRRLWTFPEFLHSPDRERSFYYPRVILPAVCPGGGSEPLSQAREGVGPDDGLGWCCEQEWLWSRVEDPWCGCVDGWFGAIIWLTYKILIYLNA